MDMRIQFPDVSIITALHDTAHIGHSLARHWFSTKGRFGWATCPLTQNGFMRIASQPSINNSPYADRVLKVPVNKVQASFRRGYLPIWRRCASERRLLFPDGGFQPPARGSA